MANEVNQHAFRKALRYQMEGRTLTELDFRQLFESLADSSFDELASDREFGDLAREVYAAYAYEEADHLEGFTVGALWAAVGMVEAKQRSIAEQAHVTAFERIAGRYSTELGIIGDNPGITQKQILKHVHYEKSNLSQRMSKLKGAGLVREEREGRFKHYYLTPLAIKLLGKNRNGKNGVLRNATTSMDGGFDHLAGHPDYSKLFVTAPMQNNSLFMPMKGRNFNVDELIRQYQNTPIHPNEIAPRHNHHSSASPTAS